MEGVSLEAGKFSVLCLVDLMTSFSVSGERFRLLERRLRPGGGEEEEWP